MEHEVRNRNGVLLGQQRLVYAGRRLENGRRPLDYSIVEGSIVFVMLRLLGGMQFPWKGPSRLTRRLDTAQPTETTAISTMCRTRSCVWSGTASSAPLVQQSLSDECLARIVLCCHFSLDLLCTGFYDVSHDVSHGLVGLGTGQAGLFRAYIVGDVSAVVDELDVLGKVLQQSVS